MYRAGFIGADNVDIILYLTRILTNLKQKTAIIDATDEQLLRYSVPEEDQDELTYRGVDLYFNQIIPDKLEHPDTEKYDALVLNYGFNHYLKSDMKRCNTIIISTDFDRIHVLKLKEMLDKLEDLEDISVIKIYRDVLKTKISPKYIDTLLNIKRFKIEKEYIIPFHMDDRKARLISQYDDIFSFSGISDKLRNLLIDLAESHMNFDSKTFSKALKKAEKGC